MPRGYFSVLHHLQEFLSLEGRNPFYPAKKAEPGIFRVPEVFFIPGVPPGVQNMWQPGCQALFLWQALFYEHM